MVVGGNFVYMHNFVTGILYVLVPFQEYIDHLGGVCFEESSPAGSSAMVIAAMPESLSRLTLGKFSPLTSQIWCGKHLWYLIHWAVDDRGNHLHSFRILSMYFHSSVITYFPVRPYKLVSELWVVIELPQEKNYCKLLYERNYMHPQIIWSNSEAMHPRTRYCLL